MTIHERAVDAAMEIECKKDRLAQNQDGTWKLTLTVAPDGLPDAVMKAAPGVRYRAFFVEVDDQEEPVKHAPAPTEKPKKRFHELPLSQQAALRCGDVKFQGFLSEKYPADWEMLKQSAGTRDTTATMAAALVRRCCGGIGGLLSRRELDTDEGAANRWKSLNAEYEAFAGLAPQAR